MDIGVGIGVGIGVVGMDEGVDVGKGCCWERREVRGVEEKA